MVILILTRSTDFTNADADDVYDILEKNIEWSEFDEVIQRIPSDALEYNDLFHRLLDMSFRFVIFSFYIAQTTKLTGLSNPDKLPKFFDRHSRWSTALETNDLGRLVHSFRYLYKFSEEVRRLRSFHISSYMHGLLAPLRRGLGNPLTMALAEICSTYRWISYDEENIMSKLLKSSGNNLSGREKSLLTPYSVLAGAANKQVLHATLHQQLTHLFQQGPVYSTSGTDQHPGRSFSE